MTPNNSIVAAGLAAQAMRRAAGHAAVRLVIDRAAATGGRVTPARYWDDILPSALRATGWGFGLPIDYLVWLPIAVAMYPLAWRYAERKRSRPRWWMRYL